MLSKIMETHKNKVNFTIKLQVSEVSTEHIATEYQFTNMLIRVFLKNCVTLNLMKLGNIG